MIIATAYRWGWFNSHSYLVYVGNDETRAMELAQNERVERGGGYGVDVIRCTEEIEEEERRAYFSSTFGESEPYLNSRLMWFERVGAKVCAGIDDSRELPEWLVGVMEQEWANAEILCTSHSDGDMPTISRLTQN